MNCKSEPRRITDAKALGVDRVILPYSSINPFSIDGRILVLLPDRFAIADGKGAVNHFYPPLRADSRPKWFGDRLLYFSGNQIMEWGRPERLAVFPEYTAIDDGGEADTWDGMLPLYGVRPDGRYDVLWYDAGTGIQGAPILTLDAKPESLYLIGDLIIVSTDTMDVFNLKLKWQQRIADYNPHKDVVMWRGRPYLISSNAGQSPITAKHANGTPCKNAIIMTDLETGEETCILELGWHPDLPGIPNSGGPLSDAVHIACPDDATEPGIVISVYSKPEASPIQYSNAIWNLFLDGREPRKICDHGATVTSYETQPHLGLRRNGKALVYSSNVADGVTPDCYLVDV